VQTDRSVLSRELAARDTHGVFKITSTAAVLLAR
jgi:hypothetical protein